MADPKIPDGIELKFGPEDENYSFRIRPCHPCLFSPERRSAYLAIPEFREAELYDGRKRVNHLFVSKSLAEKGSSQYMLHSQFLLEGQEEPSVMLFEFCHAFPIWYCDDKFSVSPKEVYERHNAWAFPSKDSPVMWWNGKLVQR